MPSEETLAEGCERLVRGVLAGVTDRIKGAAAHAHINMAQEQWK